MSPDQQTQNADDHAADWKSGSRRWAGERYQRTDHQKSNGAVPEAISCPQALPTDGGVGETYIGHINRSGVDVGIKGGGVMTWAVLAPTTELHPHALAGKYVGASGDVSFGLGGGAKVLVGGSHRTVTLQPLSVEGQVGVNLALAVAGLTLRPTS